MIESGEIPVILSKNWRPEPQPPSGSVPGSLTDSEADTELDR